MGARRGGRHGVGGACQAAGSGCPYHAAQRRVVNGKWHQNSAGSTSTDRMT